MTADAAPPVLRGDGVLLRAFGLDDEAARRRWGWHREIERCYASERATGPMSADESRRWADDVTQRVSDTAWAVVADGQLVGHAMLHALNHADRRARFAIGLYSPDLTGRGIGTTATRLVLRHAFGVLALHRVDLRVLSSNEAAIACYRRCGFVEEGRERETCRFEGRWHDDLVMGVLAREFRAVDGTLPPLT